MSKSTKPGMATPSIDIGISTADRAKIAAGLSDLLADSYALYLMTHNFHWNVTGPHFNSLHQMFMQQYTEQWNALDVIAERIRALGHPAPGTYAEFARRSSFREVEGVPGAEDMVRHLVAAQEATARTARRLLLWSEGGRPADRGPLTQRLEVHGRRPGCAACSRRARRLTGKIAVMGRTSTGCGVRSLAAR